MNKKPISKLKRWGHSNKNRIRYEKDRVTLNKNRFAESFPFNVLSFYQGFGSVFFFADPDLGKNLHADLDPDPGGIRGRGLGVKGKNDFFFSFFHVSDDS